MKNKGFTLPEIIVSTAISTVIAAILLGLFLAGRNSWLTSSVAIDLQLQARRAMDAMIRELLQTSSSQVQITDCNNYNNPSVPTTSCAGDIITFKLPVASDQSDIMSTIYKIDGTIKWGDVESEFSFPIEGRNINFFVETAPSNKLIRRGWETVVTCFLSGTPILMANHTLKPIEQVKAGDEIIAFDEETKTLVKDKVSRFFEHMANQYLIINNRLKVTPEHQVYSQDKWVEIGSLKVGDMLFNSEGKLEMINDIKTIKEKVKVYNLEVNPYHTYFAEGYLVHNKNPYSEPQSGPGLIEIKDIASDITQVNFTGFASTGQQIDINPSMVEIIIQAERQTLLGRTFNVTLTSRVSLRN